MAWKNKWNRFNLIGKRLSFGIFFISIIYFCYVAAFFRSATWMHIDYTWFIDLICILEQIPGATCFSFSLFRFLFPSTYFLCFLSLFLSLVLFLSPLRSSFYLSLIFILPVCGWWFSSHIESNMNKSLWYFVYSGGVQSWCQWLTVNVRRLSPTLAVRLIFDRCLWESMDCLCSKWFKVNGTHRERHVRKYYYCCLLRMVSFYVFFLHFQPFENLM